MAQRSTELHLKIPRVPVGPNGPGGLLRMHYFKRSEYFQDWVLDVRSQISCEMTPDPGLKYLVAVHQVRTRLMDPDNLTASCKPIFDAIVRWGLIYDDGPDHLEIKVTQEKGKPPRTEIAIAAMAPIGFCKACRRSIFTTYSEHFRLEHMNQHGGTANAGSHPS